MKPLTLSTDEEKTIYAAGLFVYQRSLQLLNLCATELAIGKQAIADAAADKPALDLDTWQGWDIVMNQLIMIFDDRLKPNLVDAL